MALEGKTLRLRSVKAGLFGGTLQADVLLAFNKAVAYAARISCRSSIWKN